MNWQKWFTKFPQWIAYFSPEIYIDGSLWSTAGGLAIIGHSHLRASKRLNLPVFGVTIRWRQGFYSQRFGTNGMYPEYPEDTKKDSLVDTGIKVRVQIKENPNVFLAIKIVPPNAYGTAPVVCLDADIEENDFISRQNTKGLYPNDENEKIARMIILGIGGIKALKALNISVRKYHLNEPYPFLVSSELISRKMAGGSTFEQAVAWTKERVVFTTHTPVIINETLNLERMIGLGCFPKLSKEKCLTREQLAHLGRNGKDGFSPIAFCLRTAGIANAVSDLHAQTSNQMLDWVDGRCQIIRITNGVDVPFWQLKDFAEAKTPEALKKAKLKHKDIFLGEVEEQYAKKNILKAFSANKLTGGWNRRYDGYKRPDLIYSENNWFAANYLDTGKIQMIQAGKPHLSDEEMKKIVNWLWEQSKHLPNLAIPEENGYAFKIRMKAGVDFWLLTSRRPWEASEDCFMSAMLNGAIPVSTYDGAALEAKNCFLFGSEKVCLPQEQNAQDFDGFKKILPEITRLYYEKPDKWNKMALAAKEESESRFSAVRMVKECASKLYQ